MKSKVTPLHGKHLSLKSMLSEAMGDDSLRSGYIFMFDEDSVMSFGHFGVTRSQSCMASMALLLDAMRCMEQDDE